MRRLGQTFRARYTGAAGPVLTAIPGLALDIDASKLGLANGASVAQALDQSGNSNHASQATGSLQPTFNSTGFHGLPSIRFDGIGDVLTTTSFLGTGYNKALSYFIVCAGQPTATKVMIGNQAGVWYCGRDQYQVLFANSAIGTKKIGYSPTSGYTFSIEGFSYDGATARYMSNGAYLQSAQTANLGVSGTLTIGNYSSGGFAYPWDLARLLVYNAGLTLPQMQTVAAYLASRYSVPLCTRKFVFEGDSLTAGFGATTGNDYPSQLEHLLGSKSGDYVWQRGVSGDTLAGMIGQAVNEVDTVAGTNVQPTLFIWGGTNDLKAALKSGTALHTDYASYCSARRTAGLRVIATTILPRSDSGIAGSFEAERQAFNTLVRANWTTYADALNDPAGDARIGDAGCELNTTYYLSDHVHMTDAGYTILANGGQTALASLGIV